MDPQFIVHGIIWFVVFLFSTTCHEASHAFAAMLGGDYTAAYAGQASLDPLPHIRREPWGMVVIPIVSYFWAHWMIGWASAPYDPEWQHRYPRRAAWMALAGPAANFILMLIAAAGIRTGLHFGVFQPGYGKELTSLVEATRPGLAGFAAAFVSILFVLNLLLGCFNLLPFPPLDGSTGITLLMSEETARRFIQWVRQSGMGWMGVMLAWVVFDKIFGFVLGIAFSILFH